MITHTRTVALYGWCNFCKTLAILSYYQMLPGCPYMCSGIVFLLSVIAFVFSHLVKQLSESEPHFENCCTLLTAKAHIKETDQELEGEN